jgi:hypothetical protein
LPTPFRRRGFELSIVLIEFRYKGKSLLVGQAREDKREACFAGFPPKAARLFQIYGLLEPSGDIFLL